jgi:hypothetical protein
MRPLFILTALAILATPALAQNSSTENNKDKKQTAPQEQTVKPSQNSNTSGNQPPSQPAQDNSMADYNVLGSTAQAAFGHDGP